MEVLGKVAGVEGVEECTSIGGRGVEGVGNCTSGGDRGVEGVQGVGNCTSGGGGVAWPGKGVWKVVEVEGV